jgi:hypothetical protein
MRPVLSGSHVEVMESIRLFGKEVLPYFHA